MREHFIPIIRGGQREHEARRGFVIHGPTGGGALGPFRAVFEGNRGNDGDAARGGAIGVIDALLLVVEVGGIQAEEEAEPTIEEAFRVVETSGWADLAPDTIIGAGGVFQRKLFRVESAGERVGEAAALRVEGAFRLHVDGAGRSVGIEIGRRDAGNLDRLDAVDGDLFEAEGARRGAGATIFRAAINGEAIGAGGLHAVD